ncbi:MAG: hypothetical protein HFH66_10470 [Lachnospiraceae bacterium]|jgi:hypothetical protein|nr:hypothetical protein [Lachnospiraceae bacterium]
MSSKRRNSKKALKEKRRASRYNSQLKKEVSDMQENVNEVKEDVEGGAVTDSIIEETSADSISGITTGNTESTTEPESTVDMDIKTENMEAKASNNTNTIQHKLYIQYNELEFSDELMFEAAINDYCNAFNQDKSSVQSVNLYVKPQEGKAYYVINNDGEKSGAIEL